MLQPITPHLALAALLVSLAATAQAPPPGRGSPRSIVLTGKAGEAPLLSLVPGSVTVLLLDAPLVQEAVEVEGRARFAVVDVGELTVTLSPSVALEPDERLALRVTYREGFPATAVFLLTAGQPGQGDEVVKVLRPQQPGAACRVEMAVLRGQCEAQRQELEALKAQPMALSPAAFVAARSVDGSGIQGKSLADACNRVRGTLHARGCEVLGAVAWSVVVFEVSNTAEEPWVPAWAEVTPAKGGAPQRARAVLSGQPVLSAGASTRMAIEVEMPARKSDVRLTEPHTLRVCNGDGSRCLSVPKVKL